MKHYTKVISYELAVKLKEAGFDYPCQRYYSIHEIEEASGSRFAMHLKNWNNNKHNVSMPTYAEVFDWLMNKGINIYIRGCNVDVWDTRKLEEVYSSFDDTCGWNGLANKGIDAALELL